MDGRRRRSLPFVVEELKTAPLDRDGLLLLLILLDAQLLKVLVVLWILLVHPGIVGHQVAAHGIVVVKRRVGRIGQLPVDGGRGLLMAGPAAAGQAFGDDGDDDQIGDEAEAAHGRHGQFQGEPIGAVQFGRTN